MFVALKAKTKTMSMAQVPSMFIKSGDLDESDARFVRLIKLAEQRFVPGYWLGMRQASFLVSLDLARLEISADLITSVDKIFAQLQEPKVASSAYQATESIAAGHPLIARVLQLALFILQEIGMPVMGGCKALSRNSDNSRRWVLGLPAISDANSSPVESLALACALVNSLDNAIPINCDQVAAEIKKLANRFGHLAPQGVNTLRFLQAAHNLNIPWCHVANNVYQLGWGRRARWLDSSFTDETPVIGAKLARDKLACSRVLRAAGLPVPRHWMVSSAEQAVKVSQALGYPVVLKPANLDGGRGIFVGLHSPQSVQRAYEEVSKISRRILIEQFIPGDDYRLQIFKGEVFWAIRRRPASVRGDGTSTVAQLVQRTNLNRKQSVLRDTENPMQEQGRSEIALNSEAVEWLKKQELEIDSVPKRGQYVRLCGAANVARGGTREGVPLDEIHPDNLILAARAATTLRLDLAGIDFLTPDISKSWRETDGKICEVNAQPQLAGHLQLQLLPRLVPMRGRIPVVAIYLSNQSKAQQDLEKHLLEISNCSLALVRTAQQCRQALLDLNVDSIVWLPIGAPQSHGPSPVDIFDLLVISRELARDVSQHPAANQAYLWRGLSARQIWLFGKRSGKGINFDYLPAELKTLFPKALRDDLSLLFG